MSNIIPIETKSLPEDCFVFKHSTQCPISGDAAEEVKKHRWTLPLYWINVIEQRPISNWVEEQYHTRHESPQLLLLRKGKVVRVLNHREIRGSAFPAFEA